MCNILAQVLQNHGQGQLLLKTDHDWPCHTFHSNSTGGHVIGFEVTMSEERNK